MKTTKPLPWMTVALATILALLAWATPAFLLAQDPDAPPTPPTIHERSDEFDCRCIDADGNEIEECVCLRRPLEGLRDGLEGLRGGLEGLRGGLEVVRGGLPELGITLNTLLRRRARIGVSIDYAQLEPRGAVIRDVQHGSPAAEAGLQVGDVVTHVAGRSVLEPLEDAAAEGELDEDRSVAVQRFALLVGDLDPGEAVELALLRDGRELTLEVVPEPAGVAVGLGYGEGDAPRIGSYRFFPEGEIMRLDAGGRGFHVDSLRSGIDSLEVRLRRGLEPLREMRWRFELDDDEGATVYRFRGPEGADTVRFFGDSSRWRELSGGGGGSLTLRASPEAELCLRLRRGQGRAAGLTLLGGNCVAGAELIDLNPDLGSYFGTEEGVLVAQVAEGTPLGLRAGDVILALDGRRVRSAAHARRILESYESDEEIRLRILREGDEREVLGRRR
jgi:hypothetical protein